MPEKNNDKNFGQVSDISDSTNATTTNSEGNNMRKKLKLDKILKIEMKRQNLSVRQLAKMADVSPSSLQDYTAGVIPRDLPGAKRIADSLAISFEYLLFGESGKIEEVKKLRVNGMFTGSINIDLETVSKCDNDE